MVYIAIDIGTRSLIPIHQKLYCSCDIVTSIQTYILVGFDQSEKCQCWSTASSPFHIGYLKCELHHPGIHRHLIGVLYAFLQVLDSFQKSFTFHIRQGASALNLSVQVHLVHLHPLAY